MKIILTLLFFSATLFSSAQTFNSPESVEYDVNHQRYVVANTSGNNLLQVIPGSAPALFVSGVPSPYGIAIVGDTVYVCCSSTHLRGYNLTTGAQAFDVNLGGTFLNGICTDFAGNIFVTDFTAKKIVRYNIASQQFNYFVGTAMAKTPNGIVYDPFHHRLAIAAWGTNAPILGLSLTDSTITTLKPTTLTNIDGLTIDEDGNFYAASWLNNAQGIYFFDSAFVNTPIRVVSYANTTNPADISYNTLSDTLAVPNTGNNTVRFYGFPRPRPTNDFATATVSVPQTICVLQNDLISGNVPLVLQSFSSPQSGSAVTNGNCIDYTASSTGNDTISYVVCSVDTPSFCRTGILVVTNLPGGGNNAPVANDDTASTTQPNSITVNVTANDLDADLADTLCISIISLSNYFSTDSTNCGNIIYTPDSSIVGNDTCLYVVCDNGNPVLCDTASLVVTSMPRGGNNAPVANDDTASTTQPNSITVNVTANDLDADLADTLCITIISLSNYFSTDSTNCGNIIYTPDSSFFGNDTCVYVACDNGSPVLCDTSSLIVTVNACPPPNFTLIYFCGEGCGSSLEGCYYSGQVAVVGTNLDSISWTVIDESHSYLDTTFINDDTLSLSMYVLCGIPNYDLLIPFGTHYSVCATIQNFCGSTTVCDTVTIIWSGIEEVSISNISIFPNPANNILTIDMQNNNEDIIRNYSSIEITNALGEKQKSVSKKGTGKVVSLEVGDLPNGIYLATIISDKRERRMLGKFTVNR